MRLLVECPGCRRQFDASRRPVGSRFRCHCGHVVEVERPEGHEARVVRCSACGAARTGDADQCAYCGAALTLHERDLDTVCPRCLALVSDRARFCHHCGTELAAEEAAASQTSKTCPACQNGHRLSNRQVGAEAVAVLECGRCAGFWLGHDAFRRLVERAQRDALPPGTTPESPREVAARFGLPSGDAAADTGGGRTFYRPCPMCKEMMPRKNYAHESGVIIDLCRDHGIWFDADELARILAWLRAGGGRQPGPLPDPDRPRPDVRTWRAEADLDEHTDFFRTLLNVLVGWPVRRW
ncbi:MAG TPA: zinc ribbon domain-containing protein [Gemmataceae bacterium]|nr:zinc ribbon domain-containing protein [Gemmataceae bacterium]